MQEINTKQPAGLPSPKAILTLVENQFRVNNALSKTDFWLDAGNDWKSAILDECVEAIKSIGYEWWKETKEDRNNLLIELSDLLAFTQGQVMQTMYDLDVDGNAVYLLAAADLTKAVYLKDRYEYSDPKEAIKDLAACALNDIDHDELFEKLIIATLTCGFSIEELFSMYAGKSVLNKFRNENGYAEGKYKKMWTIDGVEAEDNHFLSKIVMENNLKGYSPESIEFEKMISHELSKQYRAFLTT